MTCIPSFFFIDHFGRLRVYLCEHTWGMCQLDGFTNKKCKLFVNTAQTFSWISYLKEISFLNVSLLVLFLIFIEFVFDKLKGGICASPWVSVAHLVIPPPRQILPKCWHCFVWAQTYHKEGIVLKKSMEQSLLFRYNIIPRLTSGKDFKKSSTMFDS